MNLLPLKPSLLWLLLLWQATPPSAAPSSHFRYQRSVTLASAPVAAQACAVLDADVFAHAAPSLKDLRLYSGQSEIPYAATLSEPLQQDSEDARILNLRVVSGHILFDLEMPRRPYTGLKLDLAAQDYIARVTVSGSAAAAEKIATPLGTFTLFDLTSQKLSRSTDIPLSESTFPYLHLDLALAPAPGGKAVTSRNLASIVKAVTVPPSREAQSIYTTTQRDASLAQRGQQSVAIFKVQPRVPIERITFTLPRGFHGSFSRAVRIEARGIGEDNVGAVKPQRSAGSIAVFSVEDVTGSIFRVHKTEAGHDLSAESLSIPVSIGSNMQQTALLSVAIDNGTDASLPLSVELQMRQRRICFDMRSATAPLTLYYGDPSLDAPSYSDAALDQASANPRVATLEPELRNPAFTSASPSHRFSPHRPILRWIALLGCVCIFALLVIRRTHHRRH